MHRDLKPENILLQAGQPVIADFGIALAVAQAGGEGMTETGRADPLRASPRFAAILRRLNLDVARLTLPDAGRSK